MRKSNFSRVVGITLLTALMVAACVPQLAEETMVTVETTTSAQGIVNPVIAQSTSPVEKPEIVSETREITLCTEGAEEPVILYRYEILTVADEGHDALKKALEEHSTELEKRMQADYDTSVKNRQEIERQAGEGHGLQWVMEEHLEITRLDDCMLSGYETYYQYMGGAHPGTIRIGVNYDVATGEKLELADIVEDYDALYQKVLDYLENDFEYREGLFPDYKDMVKKFFYPEENAEYPYALQWYLTQGSLVIYFNEYDIGPYAMGPVAVEIPFEVG